MNRMKKLKVIEIVVAVADSPAARRWARGAQQRLRAELAVFSQTPPEALR